MEKINIAEILKDCPNGTKLYTTVWGDVEFIKLSDVGIITVLPISNLYNTSDTKLLYSDGKYAVDGECILFPSKDQRDWSKFHRPFKDGDILTYMFWNKPTIYIYRENGGYTTSYYAAYSTENKKFYNIPTGALAGNRDDLRFATEEEKQTLFKVIKENGYKWNAETKTLEKLIDPKFKVGDEIVKRNSISNSWIVSSVSSEYYGLKLPNGSEGIGVLPVYEQDNWELMPIVPKFKVGDRITNGKVSITIDYIDDNYYYDIGRNIANRLFIKNQDEWNLVPKKFDITTLKPFDKVLVRQSDADYWKPAFWGRRITSKSYPFITSFGHTTQAIPFKNNEWLVGTTEDCKDYYKTWV